MSQPYMKPNLQWEDPLDGKGPRKHRSHKKGARQHGKKATDEEIVLPRFDCRLCGEPIYDDEPFDLETSWGLNTGLASHKHCPATPMRDEGTSS